MLYGSSLTGDQKTTQRSKEEDSKNLDFCFSIKGCHGENPDKCSREALLFIEKTSGKEIIMTGAVFPLFRLLPNHSNIKPMVKKSDSKFCMKKRRME